MRDYYPFVPPEMFVESEFVSLEEIEELDRNWLKIVEATGNFVIALKQLNYLGVEQKFQVATYNLRNFLDTLARRKMAKATFSVDQAYYLHQINMALFGFSFFLNQTDNHITLDEYQNSQ